MKGGDGGVCWNGVDVTRHGEGSCHDNLDGTSLIQRRRERSQGWENSRIQVYDQMKTQGWMEPVRWTQVLNRKMKYRTREILIYEE